MHLSCLTWTSSDVVLLKVTPKTWGIWSFWIIQFWIQTFPVSLLIILDGSSCAHVRTLCAHFHTLFTKCHVTVTNKMKHDCWGVTFLRIGIKKARESFDKRDLRPCPKWWRLPHHDIPVRPSALSSCRHQGHISLLAITFVLFFRLLCYFVASIIVEKTLKNQRDFVSETRAIMATLHDRNEWVAVQSWYSSWNFANEAWHVVV